MAGSNAETTKRNFYFDIPLTNSTPPHALGSFGFNGIIRSYDLTFRLFDSDINLFQEMEVAPNGCLRMAILFPPNVDANLFPPEDARNMDQKYILGAHDFTQLTVTTPNFHYRRNRTKYMVAEEAIYLYVELYPGYDASAVHHRLIGNLIVEIEELQQGNDDEQSLAQRTNFKMKDD